MKKRSFALIGASFFIGLTKDIKSITAPKTKVSLPTLYAGHWLFYDELSHRHHNLDISSDLTIQIDERILNGKVEHLDERELSFLDEYGFHLRIDANDKGPISLFDEADNRTYPIKLALIKERTEDESEDED
ncbi:DUF4828 domain-containing protein [Dellaglioa sp. BT-FLS60]